MLHTETLGEDVSGIAGETDSRPRAIIASVNAQLASSGHVRCVVVDGTPLKAKHGQVEPETATSSSHWTNLHTALGDSVSIGHSLSDCIKWTRRLTAASRARLAPAQTSAVEKVEVIDAGLAPEERDAGGALQFAGLAAMGGHVPVLAIVAVGLACAVGGRVAFGLSEIGEEAVDIATVRRAVGVGDDWDCRARGHALPRDVVSVQVVRTINDAHCRPHIAVKRGVRRTLPHAPPRGIVGERPRGTLRDTAHGAIISEGILGTGRDAVGGRVICKCSPEGAIGHALPRAVLPEGVVGAPEDAAASDVLCVSPGIGRTGEDTGLGGIIGKSAIVCDITADNLGVGADSHTGLAEHVRIGEDIPGAEPDTPARVVVCELHAQRCVLSAGRLALASYVAGPSADRARIGAIVAHRGSDRTRRDAAVCDVIGEEVRQIGTHRHTSVGRIIRILPSLPVAIRHAAPQPGFSVFQLRAPEHTKPAAILREERRDAGIHAGSR